MDVTIIKKVPPHGQQKLQSTRNGNVFKNYFSLAKTRTIPDFSVSS